MPLTPQQRIGRHALLLKLGFAEAATMLDDPTLAPVMRHQLKKHFNDYWAHARRLAKTYNHTCDKIGVGEQTQDSEALLYEAFDAIYNSPDPVQAVALVKAFNAGEVKIEN